MFTRTTPECAIDSVACTKLNIQTRDVDGSPRVEMDMVYIQKASGTTYGVCPLVHDASVGMEILSAEALGKLKELLQCIERDYGLAVFGKGHFSEPGRSSEVEAETTEGLQGQLGLGGGD